MSHLCLAGGKEGVDMPVDIPKQQDGKRKQRSHKVRGNKSEELDAQLMLIKLAQIYHNAEFFLTVFFKLC